MKIQHAESNVVSSSGLGAAQTFHIRTNPHAFKMLSSGLYSDKIAAVLREIGCNAHDAHISVGKSHVPIEVKLPNSIDNQFWIQDQGPGLSHDDVMGLYTTYFASTKQDSNDFTGAFGLGSKSPFSYTDSFTVTSCFGRKRRIYSAHIGADGNPTIAQMHEADCGDETGIRVGFPVKPQDFQAFKDKASHIYRYFNPLPTIIGGEAIKPLQYNLDHTTWAILTDISSSRRPTIVMGNVSYPLIAGSLGVYSSFHTPILTFGGLLLRFPLGALQVAASREELQYDPQTQKNILAGVEQVGKHITSELEKAYNDINGDWKKRCNFRQLSANILKGMYISVEFLKGGGAKTPELIYAESHIYSASVSSNDKADVVTGVYYRKGGKSGVTSSSVIRETSGNLIPFKEEMCIITGDDVNAHGRVRKAIAEGKKDHVLLVVPKKLKKGTQADADKVVLDLKKELGDLPVISLSSLDRPPVAKRLKKGQMSVLPSDIICSKNKVYITSYTGHRNKCVFGDTKIDKWAMESINTNVKTIAPVVKILAPLIIHAPYARKYRMDKRSDWMTYDVHIKSVLESTAALDSLRATLTKHRTRYNLNNLSYQSGILSVALHCIHQQPVVWKALKPILAKHNILYTIEDIYDASKIPAVSTPGTILLAYKALLQSVKSQIIAPELTKDEDIDTKFPRSKNLAVSMVEAIARISPKAVITLIEDVLT